MNWRYDEYAIWITNYLYYTMRSNSKKKKWQFFNKFLYFSFLFVVHRVRSLHIFTSQLKRVLASLSGEFFISFSWSAQMRYNIAKSVSFIHETQIQIFKSIFCTCFHWTILRCNFLRKKLNIFLLNHIIICNASMIKVSPAPTATVP